MSISLYAIGGAVQVSTGGPPAGWPHSRSAGVESGFVGKIQNPTGITVNWMGIPAENAADGFCAAT